MDQILLIMEIVALVSVSALCIYLIVVLSRLQKIFANIQQDIQELTSRASPVFSNLEAITNKIRNITDNISEDFEGVRISLRALGNAIQSIVDFEQRIQQKIEEPVMETVIRFAAVLKGIRTFIDYFRR